MRPRVRLAVVAVAALGAAAVASGAYAMNGGLPVPGIEALRGGRAGHDAPTESTASCAPGAACTTARDAVAEDVPCDVSTCPVPRDDCQSGAECGDTGTPPAAVCVPPDGDSSEPAPQATSVAGTGICVYPGCTKPMTPPDAARIDGCPVPTPPCDGTPPSPEQPIDGQSPISEPVPTIAKGPDCPDCATSSDGSVECPTPPCRRAAAGGPDCSPIGCGGATTAPDATPAMEPAPIPDCPCEGLAGRPCGVPCVMPDGGAIPPAPAPGESTPACPPVCPEPHANGDPASGARCGPIGIPCEMPVPMPSPPARSGMTSKPVCASPVPRPSDGGGAAGSGESGTAVAGPPRQTP